MALTAPGAIPAEAIAAMKESRAESEQGFAASVEHIREEGNFAGKTNLISAFEEARRKVTDLRRTTDRMLAKGVEVVRVRKTMQTIGCLGTAGSLLIVGEVESAWLAITIMSIGTALGAFVTGGFAVNHMDIAPRHAGTLMGLTNTAGTIPGMVGVYASGLILQATGSWAMVFQVAAAITLVGWLFFLAFARGEREFD